MVAIQITQPQAPSILGVHVSGVAKLVAQGHLTSHGRLGKASRDRAEVEALAAEREHSKAAPTPPRRTPPYPRPDAEHDWLTPAHVAAIIGITDVGGKRSHAGKMPGVKLGRRLWVRRDHLELYERARAAPMRSRRFKG